MSNVLNKVEPLQYQTVELSNDKTYTDAPEQLTASLTVLRNFIAWQVDEACLEYFLLVPKRGRFMRPSNTFRLLPQICHAKYLAREQYNPLAQLCLKGYSVLFVTSSPPDDLIDYFSRYQFNIRASKKTELGKSSLFEAAWSTNALLFTLCQALGLNGETMCCVGHDGNPVYIIKRS